MNTDLEEFRKIVGEDGQPESVYQTFLEQHTELFYPPFLLNHDIHLESVISKLQIDTRFETDFAYLTKSSAVWQGVFVEIETPDKQLFTKDGVPTSKLTAAIQQVNGWKAFCDRNHAEVERRLAPLKHPLEGNHMEFRFALIIGRSNDLRLYPDLADAFQQLQRPDF